jgi:hypothetical protein
MRAAPSFELTLRLSAAERGLLALLTAVVTVALAAWAGSHVDAAAGPPGRGDWIWLVVVLVAAGIGARLGWGVSRQPWRTLRCHGGCWTWVEGGVEHDGTVQPTIDLGSWLLLTLRTQEGTVRWATVGRQRAGAAWHPLRTALFAPGLSAGAGAVELGTGESAST